MQEAPAPLASHPELDRVFARALAKDSEERYVSCNAFVDDARAALGLGPSAIAVRRRRRRVGRRLVVTGAAVLAAAAAAVVLALTLRSGDHHFVAPPNSVALVDPVSLEPVAAVPVGNTPTETAASSRWIWVINSNDGAGTISRIDSRTRRVASTFSVGGTPRSIVAAFGSLWVGTSEGRVVRVEPGTDLIEKSWTLPNAGESTAFVASEGLTGWLATGPDAVWAASPRTISRIDPVTSRLTPKRSSAWGPMAYGFGSLWVLGEDVERLSPTTMRRIATVDLAGDLGGIATGLGSVWVTNDESGAVVRIDPQQEAVLRTYDVSGQPSGVAVGAGAIWVPSDTGAVARINPLTDEVETVGVGGAPRNVVVAPGGVWISVD
jgi:DNA-binding beta-propeller fold protein YncE